MASKFIRGKNVRCLGCGSSLIRQFINERTKRIDKCCFVCGAGTCELSKLEAMGLDAQQALALVGREPGSVSQILPRINTPGATWSSIRFTEEELETLEAYMRETKRGLQ